MRYSKLLILMAGTVISLFAANCTTAKTTKVTTVENETTAFNRANVNYETHIKPIMSESCIGCHGGKQPAVGLNLETYTLLKSAIEKNSLIDRIHDENAPMPPGNLLPSIEQQMIDAWSGNGYKKE